jgi:hypothetical protein
VFPNWTYFVQFSLAMLNAKQTSFISSFVQSGHRPWGVDREERGTMVIVDVVHVDIRVVFYHRGNAMVPTSRVKDR